MKTKLTLLAISSSLVLGAHRIAGARYQYQQPNTLTQTWKYQKSV